MGLVYKGQLSSKIIAKEFTLIKSTSQLNRAMFQKSITFELICHLPHHTEILLRIKVGAAVGAVTFLPRT